METIRVLKLSKSYKVFEKKPGVFASIGSIFHRTTKTVQAVKEISFSIKEGELVGFIGPNGAGKTTTLKCLSGLLYPSSGSVKVLGFTPYDRKSAYLKQISFIMGQRNQLWWDLPAIETIRLNKEIYEIPDEKYSKTLAELTELLDVAKILHTPVRQLSLGQRMKMELIASLIHSPKVLFLDEPTIGLDVIMQKNIRTFLRQYNKKNNASIILTSHYMADVKELCPRVIVIDHGDIVFDGKLSRLIQKYADTKIVTLDFTKSTIDMKKLSQIGVIHKYEDKSVVMIIPSKKTKEIITTILGTFPVKDLTIEEPDVEEVIRLVFAKPKSQ